MSEALNPKRKIVLRLPSEADMERARQGAIEMLEKDGFYEFAARIDAERCQLGVLLEGQGICLGRWHQKGLSMVFNVFAAPRDMPDVMTYDDAVEKVAALKNWHGRDGTNYADAAEIRRALADGSYGGGWVIPPRELLTGVADEDETCGSKRRKIIQPDNLYDRSDCGAFRRTFRTEESSSASYPDWYWSSTKHADGRVWNACFSRFYEDRNEGDQLRMSCRPVRLVPIKPR